MNAALNAVSSALIGWLSRDKGEVSSPI